MGPAVQQGGDDNLLLIGDTSPRTPYAALAYSQGRRWRDRCLVRMMAALMFVGVVLMALGLSVPPPAAGHIHMHQRQTGGVLADGLPGSSWSHGPMRRVLVLDCGSSGTRIYAYSWQPPLLPGLLPIVRLIPPSAAAAKVPRKLGKGLYERVETQPGLHTFANDIHAVQDKSLGPLLEWARAVVSRRERASTPLLLLGTGGLRRLHTTEREELLVQVRSFLGKSGFLFKPSWARVISGAEEAVYGWVALNYGQGVLGRLYDGAGSATVNSKASPRTVGALDLGGSSLEVAFELADPPSRAEAHTGPGAHAPGWHAGLVNVTLAGSTHWLHTHAFHSYGLNEAFDRAVTLLLHDEDQRKEVSKKAAEAARMQAEEQARRQAEEHAQQQPEKQQQPMVEHQSSPQPQEHQSAPAQVTPPQQQEKQALSGRQGQQQQPTSAAQQPAREPALRQEQQDAVAKAPSSASDASAAQAPPSTSASTPTAALQDAQPASATQPAPGGFPQLQRTAAVEGVHLSPSEALAAAASLRGDDGSPMDAIQSSSPSVHSQDTLAVGGGPRRLQGATTPAAWRHGLPTPQPTSSYVASPFGSRDPARWAAAARIQRDWSSAVASVLLGPQRIQSSSSRSAGGCSSGRSTRSSSDGGDGGDTGSGCRDNSRSTGVGGGSRSGVGGDSSSSSSSSGAGDSSSQLLGSAIDVMTNSRRRLALQGATTEAGEAAPSQAPAPVAPAPDTSNDAAVPVVHHPCLHEGYDALYSRIIYHGLMPDPSTVRLVGAQDFGACVALAGRLVNASAPCELSGDEAHGGGACILGSIQPRLAGSFTALTGFYVVSTFLRLRPGAAPADLLPAAQRMCSLPWRQVQADMGDVVNVERYCTWGPYVALLLQEGLGLANTSRLTFGRGDVAWPLGAALVEAANVPGFMPSQQARPPRLGSGWALGFSGTNWHSGGSWQRAPLQSWQLVVLIVVVSSAAWLMCSALRPRLPRRANSSCALPLFVATHPAKLRVGSATRNIV